VGLRRRLGEAVATHGERPPEPPSTAPDAPPASKGGE
jgi:hypothetical protein